MKKQMLLIYRCGQFIELAKTGRVLKIFEDLKNLL